MAAKRYDPSDTDSDVRYARWVAALEAGDEAELLEATMAIPTLKSRVLDEYFAVDGDDLETPGRRAMEQRLIVLLSEVRPREAARIRELRKARQRRHDRTTRIERTVELPAKCARCGGKLQDVKPTGRPRIYCTPACRKAEYEDRRAHRDGAVKVQVVEKVVTEVRERRIEVPHPRSDCIKAVFADDDILVEVIWALIDEVRDRSKEAFSPDQPRFWDLYNNVEVLYEALVKRAGAGERLPVPSPAPTNRYRRNLELMTRRCTTLPADRQGGVDLTS